MPSPWRKVAYLAVGGLTEVGFAAGFLLLVVSHQGRGVVDLASGELLARDRHETGAWFDAARRAALGIGPLDGTWIGVCGLAGRFAPSVSRRTARRSSSPLRPAWRSTVAGTNGNDPVLSARARRQELHPST